MVFAEDDIGHTLRLGLRFRDRQMDFHRRGLPRGGRPGHIPMTGRELEGPGVPPARIDPAPGPDMNPAGGSDVRIRLDFLGPAVDAGRRDIDLVRGVERHPLAVRRPDRAVAAIPPGRKLDRPAVDLAVPIRAPNPDDIRRIVSAEVEKPGVWNADLANIRTKIEKFPFVKSASVSRMLPAGIRVDIVERIPAAIVHLKTGDFLIDGEGAILSVLETRRALGGARAGARN